RQVKSELERSDRVAPKQLDELLLSTVANGGHREVICLVRQAPLSPPLFYLSLLSLSLSFFLSLSLFVALCRELSLSLSLSLAHSCSFSLSLSLCRFSLSIQH